MEKATTLNIYRFPDGTKAYFFDGDRKHHFRVGYDEVLHIDGVEWERNVVKEMKISYVRWLKMIGMNDNFNNDGSK